MNKETISDRINKFSKFLPRLVEKEIPEDRKLSAQDNLHLAWAEIDLKAVLYNYRQIKQLSARKIFPSTFKGRKKGIHILAVVKADAYGHGMRQVAGALQDLDVSFFGVSDVREGIALREQGIRQPVLLLENILPQFTPQVVDYDLTPTVCTLSLATALDRYARAARKTVDIHIKIDTGMSRLGVGYAEAIRFIRRVSRFSRLSVKGLYTHFPIADTNPDFTRRQAQQIFDLLENLGKDAETIEYIHAANSMGLAGYETQIFNLARPGLMLYGLYPHPRLKEEIHLRPAMQVKARVIFLKKIKKGQGVSYGHTFIAKNDMMIATLPIGYSDGYLRCLSNKSAVLIAGQPCPVIGRVTMDQIIVDVSHLKSVRLGTEVVILGSQGGNLISADDLAGQADTISYEILCHLGSRLPRMYRR